jgi:hypothetical protein
MDSQKSYKNMMINFESEMVTESIRNYEFYKKSNNFSNIKSRYEDYL